MTEKKASTNFYFIAAIESALLASFTVYIITSHKVTPHHAHHLASSTTDACLNISLTKHHSHFGCFSPESDEYLWRIVATSIAVPLLIELLLELIISHLYPNPAIADPKIHALEDRLGHGIIVASLLPVSYVPFWIFDASVCNFRDAFVSIGHSMIVCGVLGKLETFSSDIWHQSDAIMVLTLFFGAQVSLLSGFQIIDGVATYSAYALQIGCALKLLSTLIFLTSSRNIQLVFREMRDGTESNFFTTRKYLCTTLFLGLTLFMFVSTYFCYQAYVHLPDALEIIAIRILVTIMGVVVTAIFPGRIMRRGLQAMQQTVAIQVRSFFFLFFFFSLLCLY